MSEANVIKINEGEVLLEQVNEVKTAEDGIGLLDKLPEKLALKTIHRLDAIRVLTALSEKITTDKIDSLVGADVAREARRFAFSLAERAIEHDI